MYVKTKELGWKETQVSPKLATNILNFREMFEISTVTSSLEFFVTLHYLVPNRYHLRGISEFRLLKSIFKI
jgi:hypothetical protein